MKRFISNKFLSLIGLALLMNSCASNKIVSESNDDVYFQDISAKKIDYNYSKNTASSNDNFQNQNGDYNDDYYDGNGYNSRLNTNWNSPYSFRDYYFQNNLFGYDPFLGFNNGLWMNSGWGLSFGGNSWNNPYFFNNGFNQWNNFGWNNFGWNNFGGWNNFNLFYGTPGFGGIYSYYNPGFYGNIGGFNNFGGGQNIGLFNPRNTNPRPRGSYDNARGDANGRIIPLPPNRSPRPDNSSPSNGRTVDNSGRSGSGSYRPNTRPSGNGSSNPSNTQPAQRPTRPSGSSSTRSNDNSRSSQPSSQPTSRPTRTEIPSSPPPSSGGSSSSSNGGGSSTSRPTRTGGN